MNSSQEVQHLWAACNEQLQRALHNAGEGSYDDPQRLKEMVKEIAIKRCNNLVNIVELQRMGQQHSETVTAFSTR